MDRSNAPTKKIRMGNVENSCNCSRRNFEKVSQPVTSQANERHGGKFYKVNTQILNDVCIVKVVV